MASSIAHWQKRTSRVAAASRRNKIAIQADFKRTYCVMADTVLESLLTCPVCQHSQIETMPTDQCVFFYECSNCHVELRQNSGDCCVFCSFGSVKCPTMQQTC